MDPRDGRMPCGFHLCSHRGQRLHDVGDMVGERSASQSAWRLGPSRGSISSYCAGGCSTPVATSTQPASRGIRALGPAGRTANHAKAPLKDWHRSHARHAPGHPPRIRFGTGRARQGMHHQHKTTSGQPRPRGLVSAWQSFAREVRLSRYIRSNTSFRRARRRHAIDTNVTTSVTTRLLLQCRRCGRPREGR
jgi:hypothetical protein